MRTVFTRLSRPSRATKVLAAPSRGYAHESLSDLGYAKPRSPFTMTKLVCTIGPTSEDSETLQKVVTEGMRVMRVNFSHATFEEADLRMTNLKNSKGSHSAGFFKDESGAMQPVNNVRASLLDTRGPEIRMGNFQKDLGKKVQLNEGETVTITTDKAFKDAMTPSTLFVDYPSLAKTMNEGDTILLDDGLVGLEVTKVDTENNCVEAIIRNGNLLGSRKGVNLPGKIVDLPPLTEKDLIDLKYGIDNDMDYVAVSFVRKPEDIRVIKGHLKRLMAESDKFPADHPIPLIISKIENGEALTNFEAILEESDGIMVARGDLGVEIPFEKVTRAQKVMIDRCRAVGKPVIVATQMLESMQNNPRPTRAEVSDVTNAVLDGADAVMLSGESANGKYPVESVKTMTTIIKEADNFNISRGTHGKAPLSASFDGKLGRREINAKMAVEMATRNNAKMILVIADTGATARLISKYRPNVPIMAYCKHPKVARQINLMHGVYPLVMHVDKEATNQEKVALALSQAKMINWLKAGDTVVCATTGPAHPTGLYNMTDGVFATTLN